MEQASLPVEGAAEHLAGMLSAARVDPQTMDLHQCWPVYMRFAQTPTDAVEEILTFSWGTYDFFLGRPTFQASLERKVTVEDGEGHTDSQQIDCSFLYEVTIDLQGRQGSIDSYEYDTLEDFFVAVETSAGFIVALQAPVYRHVKQWAL